MSHQSCLRSNVLLILCLFFWSNPFASQSNPSQENEELIIAHLSLYYPSNEGLEQMVYIPDEPYYYRVSTWLGNELIREMIDEKYKGYVVAFPDAEDIDLAKGLRGYLLDENGNVYFMDDIRTKLDLLEKKYVYEEEYTETTITLNTLLYPAVDHLVTYPHEWTLAGIVESKKGKVKFKRNKNQ